MTVLVFTHAGDEYVPDVVAAAVRSRGHDVVRVDTDRFPSALSLAVSSSGRALLSCDDDVEVDLARVSAVWLRRLWPGHAPPDVDARYADACARQAAEALDGAVLWLEDSGARVVNALAAQRRAENKVVQLRELTELRRFDGQAFARALHAPPTLVTNDVDAARAFLAEHRGFVVAKTLSALSDDNDDFVYTSAVDDVDALDIAAIAHAPMILQRRIEKVRDVRVVVVGDRVLAASCATAALDWRLDRGARWTTLPLADLEKSGDHGGAATTLLPARVARGCIAIVRRLGLVFGAVDLVVDGGGAHWFLEVNPAGEWGFLQRDCGLDVAGAIADVLT